jgi:hypothetical protein
MASIPSTSEAAVGGLESLLRGEKPEERERIIRAWHDLLQGDPESFPVQFALVTRGVGKVLAATVEEARKVSEEAAAARAEIDQARNALALEIDRKIDEVKAAFESARKLPGEIEAAAGSARQAASKLSESGKTKRFGWLFFLACFLIGAAGAGYWTGGEWRVLQERDKIGGLLHRWQQGDGDAYNDLIERIGRYRETHQIVEP